jgi:hypothetical protein
MLALMYRRAAGRCAAVLVLGAVMGVGVADTAAPAGPPVAEGFVNAPPAEVWRLFVRGAAADTAAAAVTEPTLRIGGEIRSANDPGAAAGDRPAARGTIVNQVHAYDPERMLALRVREVPGDFPYPEAARRTWKVMYFQPAGEGMTQVRVVVLGDGEDPQARALRELFAASERRVLERIAKPYWPKCAKCERDALEQQ